MGEQMSSCNGCSLKILKERYGDRLIKLNDSWYVINQTPLPGQEIKSLSDGIPVRFVAWFMNEGHDHENTALDDLIEGIY